MFMLALTMHSAIRYLHIRGKRQYAPHLQYDLKLMEHKHVVCQEKNYKDCKITDLK